MGAYPSASVTKNGRRRCTLSDCHWCKFRQDEVRLRYRRYSLLVVHDGVDRLACTGFCRATANLTLAAARGRKTGFGHGRRKVRGKAEQVFHFGKDSLALLVGQRAGVVHLGRGGGFICLFPRLPLQLVMELFLLKLAATEPIQQIQDHDGVVREFARVGEFKEAVFELVSHEDFRRMGIIFAVLSQGTGAVIKVGTLVSQNRADDLAPEAGDDLGGTFDVEVLEDAFLNGGIGEAIQEPLGDGGLVVDGEVEEFGVGAGFAQDRHGFLWG